MGSCTYTYVDDHKRLTFQAFVIRMNKPNNTFLLQCKQINVLFDYNL